jgi:hypothetical protein
MEFFTKPAAALYRARAYFVLALILWILHNTITPPFQDVASKESWQLLIDKAARDDGKFSQQEEFC